MSEGSIVVTRSVFESMCDSVRHCRERGEQAEAELAAVREALGGPDVPCTVENIRGRMNAAESLGYQCGIQHQERGLYEAEAEAQRLSSFATRLENRMDAIHRILKSAHGPLPVDLRREIVALSDLTTTAREEAGDVPSDQQIRDARMDECLMNDRKEPGDEGP